MLLFDYFKSLKSTEHRTAWAVAVAADLLQIVAFPFFAEGGLSPLDTVLDLITAAVLTRLLGWHWAFLPTLAVEMVPGLDLVPTWTAAVFLVTRDKVRGKSTEPEILAPGPAPAPRS